MSENSEPVDKLNTSQASDVSSEIDSNRKGTPPTWSEVDEVGDQYAETASFELDDLIETLAHERRQTNSLKRAEARKKLMQDSRFVLPARAGAIACLFVAIAATTALVIVADSKDANALSTIALALAVLAFVIQVMVFIYQSQTSHQQMMQGEQLYTETRALLTEVRTAANSTETLVREQFRDLLKAFMDAAPSSSESDGGFDSEAFEKRLFDGLRKEMVAASPRQDSPRRPPLAAPSRISESRLRRSQESRALFRTFPDESEGRSVLPKLASIGQEGRRRLVELAEDEINSRSAGEYLGLAPDDIDEKLIEEGLAVRARVRSNDSRLIVTRLSDQGRIAARLLTGVGELPEYASGVLPADE